MKRKILIGTTLLVAVVIIAIQLVPVDRSNPPVTGEIQTSAEVMTVVRRACYDCHSHETQWPWYSYVAPVSWFIASDVRVGRGKLNFSEWGELSEEKREHVVDEIWEEVEAGEMPLGSYLFMHSEARLTEQDRAYLRGWATERAAGPHED